MNKQIKATRTLALTVLALVMALALPTVTQAQVLYTQNFNNAGGTAGTSTVGWIACIGAGAIDVSGPGSNQTYTATSAVTISGTPGSPSTPNGYLNFYNQMSAGLVPQTFTAVKTGLSLGLTSGASTITWRMNTSYSTSQELRLLVQVAGSWYVSNTNFTQTAVGVSSGFAIADTASYVFSTAAANWSSFSLTPSADYTGTMAIGSPLSTDLSTSTITGIGFYTNIVTRYQSVRIDSLEINAVPEPSTMAMLLLGASGMLLTGIRKRRS